jgi:hypothetical protein
MVRTNRQSGLVLPLYKEEVDHSIYAAAEPKHDNLHAFSDACSKVFDESRSMRQGQRAYVIKFEILLLFLLDN